MAFGKFIGALLAFALPCLRHSFFCAGLLIFYSCLARADPPVWPIGWDEWQRASGEWGGLRTNLENSGIDFELNFTSDILANPVGGILQRGAYAGALFASFDMDMEKLVGWDGMVLSFGFFQGLGEDLSEEAIGSTFDVAEIFIGDIFGLSEFKFSQSLRDDQFNFELGRLTVGQAFGGTEAFQYYVNNGANGSPSQLSTNLSSFTTVPYNQWGVYGRYQINPSSYISAGAYNASSDALIDGNSGFNFRFNPEDGVLFIGQTGFFVGQDGTSSGLPGRYHLGGFYDTSQFTSFLDPTSEIAGNWGFYAIADQMVYREQGEQGLTLWAVAVIAPQQRINTFPWGGNAGFYYKGLLPGRDDDVTAAAAILGVFSEDLTDQTFELVIEANHRFQFTPWFYGVFDFQYVVNPGGRGDIPDAWVFGTEISIDF